MYRPLTRQIQPTAVTAARMAFITLLFPESLSVCSARGHSVHRDTLSCMANSRRGTAMHAAVAAHAVRPGRAVFLARVVCKHDQDLQVLRWLAAQHVTNGNAYIRLQREHGVSPSHLCFCRYHQQGSSLSTEILTIREQWAQTRVVILWYGRGRGSKKRRILFFGRFRRSQYFGCDIEVRGNSPRRLLPTPTGRLSGLL